MGDIVQQSFLRSPPGDLRSLSILVIRARTLACVSGSSSPGAAFQYVTTFRITKLAQLRF